MRFSPLAVTHLDHSLFDPTQHRRELGGVKRETQISRDQPPEHHSTHINHLKEKEGRERQHGAFLKMLFFTLIYWIQTRLSNYFVESVLSFEYQRSPGSTVDSPRLLEPRAPL